MDNTKIIKIVDPQAGRIEEQVLETKPTVSHLTELESLGLGQFKTLQEAATTSEFPTLLLSGLKSILFDSYAGDLRERIDFGANSPSTM